MARTSFLDKFSMERAPGERHGLTAVMRNVQAMLSTKRDYGYFLRDFGLGAYAEKTSKAGLATELAKEMEGKVTIAKVNIDQNPESPQKYGVRGIPTLILFKDGKPVATKVGSLPKGQLVEWLNSLVA